MNEHNKQIIPVEKVEKMEQPDKNSIKIVNNKFQIINESLVTLPTVLNKIIFYYTVIPFGSSEITLITKKHEQSFLFRKLFLYKNDIVNFQYVAPNSEPSKFEFEILNKNPQIMENNELIFKKIHDYHQTSLNTYQEAPIIYDIAIKNENIYLLTYDGIICIFLNGNFEKNIYINEKLSQIGCNIEYQHKYTNYHKLIITKSFLYVYANSNLDNLKDEGFEGIIILDNKFDIVGIIQPRLGSIRNPKKYNLKECKINSNIEYFAQSHFDVKNNKMIIVHDDDNKITMCDIEKGDIKTVACDFKNEKHWWNSVNCVQISELHKEIYISTSDHITILDFNLVVLKKIPFNSGNYASMLVRDDQIYNINLSEVTIIQQQ